MESGYWRGYLARRRRQRTQGLMLAAPVSEVPSLSNQMRLTLSHLQLLCRQQELLCRQQEDLMRQALRRIERQRRRRFVLIMAAAAMIFFVLSRDNEEGDESMLVESEGLR